MSELKPQRRIPARSRASTPAGDLFKGTLLVFIVAVVIVLSAWALRLRAREMALRNPAPAPARTETQPPWLPPCLPAGKAGKPAPHIPAQRAPVETKTSWDESTVQQFQRLIELEHGRNLAAIAAARLRLDDDFRRYSERIPQFTDALNSLPEKARLAKDLVQDQAQSGNETQQEAAKLFAENVVPPDQLRGDIAQVVAQFERDVEANRSIVVAAAGPGLDLPKAPVALMASGADLLLADFTGQLGRFLGSQAGEVPMSSVSSVTKSLVVEESLRKKVTAAMESHDYEPRRAAVVGTAVGVLAAAADYWLMQSRFESALTRRCQAALDKIRAALWADPQNGLEASFTSYADLVRETQLLALKRAAGKQ